MRRLLPALAAVVLVLGACSESTPEPPPRPNAAQFSDVRPAPADRLNDGGTLRIGADGWPTDFNPWSAEGASSSAAAQILAPTLGSPVRPTADGDWEVDRDYAESLDVVGTDPLTVEVTLHADAVWQDGTPVSGDDLAAFVELAQQSDSPVSAHPAYQLVESVEVVDAPSTYRVVFSRSTSDWPAAVFAPLPASLSQDRERWNEGFTDEAIPSVGPFVVDTIDEEAGAVELVRNPQWWGDPPRLERIVWRAAESEVLGEAYAADDLDALTLDADSVDSASADLIDLRYGVSPEWTQLTLGGGSGPLADTAVRQAVVAAIDRSALVSAAAREEADGVTEVMDSVVLLPRQRGYLAEDWSPDRDTAEQLLDDAGWVPDDTGVRAKDGAALELRFPVPEGDAIARQRADEVADQLAEVGIEVKVEEVEAESFAEEVIVALDFDLVAFSWTASPFPSEAVAARFAPVDSNQNFTGVVSDGLAEAVERLQTAIDGEEWMQAVDAVDAAAQTQASMLPLAPVPVTMAVEPRVRNYGPSTFAPIDWTIVGFEGGE